MINVNEMTGYLHSMVPEIDEEIKTEDANNPYRLMDKLSAFTKGNVREENFKLVSRCFKVADKLYDRGNSTVKNAVENVFVYSLTSLLNSCPQQKLQVLSLVPIGLYTLYINQIQNSGC